MCITNNSNKTFVERHYNLIKVIVSRVATNLEPEDQEDLVHNVVLNILKSDTEVDESRASAYINAVIKNLQINSNRDAATDCISRAESIDAPLEEDAGTLHDKIASPYCLPIEQVTASQAITDAIEDEIEHPSLKFRHSIEIISQHMKREKGVVFFYRYYWGMTPVDIARATGWTQDAVRSLLKRAVSDAFGLLKKTHYQRRYSGKTLQEMYLTAIEDDSLMFPYKLHYANGMSRLDICEMLDEPYENIDRAIRIAEAILEETYGYGK